MTFIMIIIQCKTSMMAEGKKKKVWDVYTFVILRHTKLASQNIIRWHARIVTSSVLLGYVGDLPFRAVCSGHSSLHPSQELLLSPGAAQEAVQRRRRVLQGE